MKYRPRSEGRPSRVLLISLAVLATLCLVAACGTGKPDYCASFDQLKTSVQNLTKINVAQGGVSAVRNALNEVETNFDTFAAAAKQEFGPQVDQLRASINTLKSTLGSISGIPTASDIATIASNVASVANAFNSLQNSVSSRCQ